MARKKPVVDATIAHDHQRGTVNDNHLKALVTSPSYSSINSSSSTLR
ncbi:alternative ribosome rescue factor ArfA [Aeromonas schubertii]|nr:alternative ribosome rescue factor ArfA [Aeromonas schubertii]